MIQPRLTGKTLDVTFDFGFLRGLAGFIAGMLVYKSYQARIAENFFKKDIAALLVIIGCILSMHFGWNDGFDILFFIGIVYSFALNREGIHHVCNRTIPQYLGKISYSIYLMQLFPLIPTWGGIKLPGLVYSKNSATAGFWTGCGYCFIYILLVIGLASLTYYTIEKPCRKWINAKWGREQMPVYA